METRWRGRDLGRAARGTGSLSRDVAGGCRHTFPQLSRGPPHRLCGLFFLYYHSFFRISNYPSSLFFILFITPCCPLFFSLRNLLKKRAYSGPDTSPKISPTATLPSRHPVSRMPTLPRSRIDVMLTRGQARDRGPPPDGLYFVLSSEEAYEKIVKKKKKIPMVGRHFAKFISMQDQSDETQLLP